jgi:hypothetical protein
LVKEVKIPRPLRIYVSGPITYKNGGKELGELVAYLREVEGWEVKTKLGGLKK